ncbi:hypothetical protein CEXT_583331 [Caerostris extrusa]|uniref:Secreted protein n=1 Tax=Caerostris extrusa TaxID=172846 RepID=A0AAV4UY44_CAEEX|nr:hypothetical protein CEXT_583331 [Caerostris extrusa]
MAAEIRTASFWMLSSILAEDLEGVIVPVQRAALPRECLSSRFGRSAGKHELNRCFPERTLNDRRGSLPPEVLPLTEVAHFCCRAEDLRGLIVPVQRAALLREFLGVLRLVGGLGVRQGKHELNRCLPERTLNGRRGSLSPEVCLPLTEVAHFCSKGSGPPLNLWWWA